MRPARKSPGRAVSPWESELVAAQLKSSMRKHGTTTRTALVVFVADAVRSRG
ncbi:hypothetical protein ABIA31_009349 [Catenulispora sp. MAP5-51]